VRRAAAVLVLVLVLAACGERPAATVEVAIDGGTDGVVLLGEHRVAAAPGDVVRIVHASPREPGAEAPTSHALVADGAEPALFLSGGGGAAPNPAVWGPCRGGPLAPPPADCPLAPVEAAASWDGAAYWSTGALLPGEVAEVPIAADAGDGPFRLVCAIHPALAVVIGDDGGDGADDGADDADDATGVAARAPDDDAAARARAARAAAEAAATPPAGTVRAGTAVDGALVQRFAPARIEVPVGGTVTWVAGGPAPLDVVLGAAEPSLAHTQPGDALPSAPEGAWDGTGEVRSGYLAARAAPWARERFTLRFGAPGTYRYTSRFSDGAIGEVVVVP
jgi:plastocyanin